MRICLYSILVDGCVIDHCISTSYQLQPDKAGRRKEWGKAAGMCPCTLYFFSLTRHPPLNFINTPLALSSATFHSRLETEHFKLSYPDSTSAPRHVRHHYRLQPYIAA